MLIYSIRFFMFIVNLYYIPNSIIKCLSFANFNLSFIVKIIQSFIRNFNFVKCYFNWVIGINFDFIILNFINFKQISITIINAILINLLMFFSFIHEIIIIFIDNFAKINFN
jgi:hypothetical protein